MGALLFCIDVLLSSLFHRGLERYIPALSVAVMLMGIFTLCQFLYGWEWPRSQSVLAPWGSLSSNRFL